MGLIKALTQAGGTVLADQWKEFFHCDAIPANVAVKRGQRKTQGNNKGGEGIISNGSRIVINEGQAMALVENGKVVEFSAEPGTYTYEQGSEPSIFAGSFGTSLVDSFKKFGERFTFGGDTGKEQRVYYFNTKELPGYRFGTAEPIVYDDPKYQSIGVRCFGTVSLVLSDPIAFYAAVAGNVRDEYRLEDLWEAQLKSEFVTYLGQSLSMLANEGVRFSQMPQHQVKLVKYMNQIMDSDWKQARGLSISSTAIPSITLDPKFQDKVNKYDDIQLMSNPVNAAASLVAAQGEAMKTAAGNENGAMMGFMGLNMAQQAGGMNANQLFQMTPPPEAPAAPAASNAPLSNGWKCECGTVNSGKFCQECGKPGGARFCANCGKEVSGKFCTECGTPVK